MYYFAYGSNLSSRRLQIRCPSAVFVSRAYLPRHDLRFHKVGRDGSGKCDAFFTEDRQDCVFGVLFKLSASDKSRLDEIEGVGKGYYKADVEVVDADNMRQRAWAYHAININASLLPFSWYLNHVVVGAREFQLPPSYQATLAATTCIRDPNQQRDKTQRQIYR